MTYRIASIVRKTKETQISLKLNIDGSGCSEISTGVGFFDHMLTSLSRHSGMDLELDCKGDLEIDDHHTIEDCAIALGQAYGQALGEKKGIRRFGFAYAPLDEALARVVLDLSGRACAQVELGLVNSTIGTMCCDSLVHALESFAINAKITLHVDIIRGRNDHHKAEAAFKALAIALKQAVSIVGSDIPSTKGVLE